MILDCKEISRFYLDRYKHEISKLPIKPKLAFILDKTANLTYVNAKKRDLDYCGVEYQDYFVENLWDTLNLIDCLNQDRLTHGILIQLPVSFDYNLAINKLDSLKDVDCLTDENQLGISSGNFYPCTVSGILDLIDYKNIKTKDKTITVINRTSLIGKPLFNILSSKKYDGNLIMLHSKTSDLSKFTKISDIIITATGKRNLLTDEMIKDNTVIFDVGLDYDENGRLVGDVNVNNPTCLITPNPGGIGRLTRYSLVGNLLKCYKKQV